MQVRLVAVWCLAMGWAPSAAAQSPPVATPSVSPTLFARAEFSLLWAALTSHDPRFSWEGRVSIDIDLVTYSAGRLNLTADYDAVLGRERRPFDLNHGNYFFDASASRRLPWVEIAGVARHVSRHLHDRINPQTISWNLAGLRAWRDFRIGRSTVRSRLEAGRAMQQAFVDYAWMSELRLEFQHPVNQRLATFAAGSGAVIGVDHAVANRNRVCGGRVEGGVRLNGRAAALELFAGYERRIDAYPLDRFRVRFFTLGFRIASR